MAKGVPTPLLWAFVGALFGVGIIALGSIGWALLLAGALLGASNAWLTRGRGAWAGLIGFGLLPALVLGFGILSAPPPCPTQPVNVSSGSYTCGEGVPTSYITLAIFFLAIALIGALIPLTARIRRVLRSPDEGSPPLNAT
jgi:hypothetical protein